MVLENQDELCEFKGMAIFVESRAIQIWAQIGIYGLHVHGKSTAFNPFQGNEKASTTLQAVLAVLAAHSRGFSFVSSCVGSFRASAVFADLAAHSKRFHFWIDSP
jgi:hypothetical protein